jgi:GNAT superfamily N-acetyltransferase
MISLTRTNSSDSDFRQLVSLLDQDLKIRDGEDHGFYSQYNKVDKIGHVVVAYLEGKPVGCGAFKEYSNDAVEIKRMYVLPEMRGRGIASQVLAELESWAAELHYNNCVLETGKKQPEAIRLYQKSSYNIIPNYGQYEGIENSVCMKKSIQK